MHNITDSLSGLKLLLGRILIAWIFLISSIGQIREFTPNVHHAADAGIPFPQLAIAVSILVQGICALAVLIGLRTRIAAWLLFLLLIPITLSLHKFWVPGALHTQQFQFLKNMGIMGGLLFLTECGAGRLSIDDWLQSRRHSWGSLTQRGEHFAK